MRNSATVIGCILLCASACADVKARVSLTPPSVPIYRTAEYTLELEGPKGFSVPKLDLAGKLKDIEVATSTPETESLDEQRERVRVHFRLDAKTAGVYLIPQATLDLGNGHTATIPAVTLVVREPSEAELAQAAQFVDIADPALVAPPRRNTTLLIALAGLLLLALVAGAYYWRKRHAQDVWVPPALKPWQVANNRLAELASRRLPHQGRYEAFYVDLTAILRYYIEDRFHLHAPERTTPEFLDEAARSGALVPEQQQTLERFLRHCDRVKFARYEPSFHEMEESFGVVERFVLDTTPSGVEATEKEAA